MKRIIRRSITLAATLLPALILMFGMVPSGNTEPEKNSRTETLQGLEGPVKIIRDSYGIPTVQAKSNHDLFFGIGYIMATDRLWQMDASRRLAEGYIAEVAGNDQLHWDTYHRTYGLGRTAEKMVAMLDPSTRANLQAFADGVNSYINQCRDIHPKTSPAPESFTQDNEKLERSKSLPMECLLMDYEPEQWKIVDSLAIDRLVALWLAADYMEEDMYQTLIDSDGKATADALFKPVPGIEPTYIDKKTKMKLEASSGESGSDCGIKTPCVTQSERTIRPVSYSEGWGKELFSRWLEPLAKLSHSGHMEASNIWAVDGSMTKSGEPILAMDPHLNYFAPSILYEIRLDGGDFHLWGATFPGLPVIPFGANEKISWGASNLPADCQDLYIEHANPAKTTEYKADGKWVPFDIIKEQIPSKGPDGKLQNYLIDVFVSRHGPIIEWRGLDGYALRWTGSEAVDDVTPFFKAMQAQSLESFYEAFRDYNSPTQNFIVAESGPKGRVGQVFAGRIPIRENYSGAEPVDGNDSKFDWNGYIPYDKLPHRLDPPEGYVAHANNLPRGGLDPKQQSLGSSFSSNYRVDRIIELLTDDTPLTPEIMREIQMDVLDISARKFVPAILGSYERIGKDYPALADKIDMVKSWNYRLNEESIPATIYQIWTIEFGKILILNHISNSSYGYIGYQDRWMPLLEEYIDNKTSLSWLKSDDQAAQDKNILDALSIAVARIQKEIGPNTEMWQWGKVHYASFPHPSGMTNFIGGGEHDWGGGRYTIRVGHYDPSSPLPFSSDFGAVFRAVAASAKGKWDITAVMPPGEGGTKLGPHFDDQMKMWLKGEQRAVPFGVNKLTPVYTIELKPG